LFRRRWHLCVRECVDGVCERVCEWCLWESVWMVCVRHPWTVGLVSSSLASTVWYTRRLSVSYTLFDTECLTHVWHTHFIWHTHYIWYTFDTLDTLTFVHAHTLVLIHCVSASLYNRLQPITTLYNFIQVYTSLYKSIQLYTSLCYSILLYTSLYKSIQLYTVLYKSIQLYTTLYKSIQLYTRLDNRMYTTTEYRAILSRWSTIWRIATHDTPMRLYTCYASFDSIDTRRRRVSSSLPSQVCYSVSVALFWIEYRALLNSI